MEDIVKTHVMLLSLISIIVRNISYNCRLFSIIKRASEITAREG